MSRRTLVVGWLTLGASLFAFSRRAAAAENADACADAYELTQSEQTAGRLFDARRDARLCAAKCPARLAKDCNLWETRITALIPSFVVHAHGIDGAPLGVDVQVDGAPAEFTETGSIEAEPGPHRLVLSHSGVRVETHVDLVAGVRNQLVEVPMPDPPSSPVLPLPAPVPAPLPPAEHHAPLWRWIVGGLGLATVAAGGAVSITGEVLAGQLRGSCAPHCTRAQADEVVQRWIIGGGVMGLGGAIALTALLWPSPSRTQPRSGSPARVSVQPGWLGIEGAF